MPPLADISTTLAGLGGQLAHIFYYIVLPVMLLAGVGWMLQRRLGLDMPTMTRLNFYYVMPAMAYSAVVTSKVSLGEVGVVVLFSLAMLVCLAAVTLVAAWARRVPRDYRNALLMTTMFYNSGNYGAPLQQLAFQDRGLGDAAFMLQTFVMITQNIMNFTMGIWLAATGRGRVNWKESLREIFKFPPIYALPAAVLTILLREQLGARAPQVAHAIQPFCDSLAYVKDAFIAIALCTLGAQLATIKHQPTQYPISVSVIIRLLVAPAIGLGLVYLFGVEGFLAQVLLISTATPTAINVMLLCLHFDNHPDYAARAVFYSTLISPITVTLVIFLAKGGFLARLG